MSLEPSDVAGWAGKAQASAEFPNVVRRLILATAPALSLVDIPGGSSVKLPGWDGRVRTTMGTAWVPEGDSVWEISCEAGPRAKASSDYSKRTCAPRGVDPSQVTYVAVTARAFSNKDTWAEERRKEGKWRDVRVVDASDIVAWLELAPVVAEQFARLVGLVPDSGYISLDEWWRGWSQSTEPKIQPGLVLAGRGQQVDELSGWFGDESNGRFVQGDTKEEAIAFLAAAAHSAEGAWGGEFLSRAVVIRNIDTWRVLCGTSSPLVMVRGFEDHVIPALPLGSGHCAVVPLGKEQDVRGQGIVLPVLGRDETVRALVAMGLGENEAVSLSSKTARRLPILHRSLLDSAGDPGPAWLTDPNVRSVANLVLVGQWEDDHAGDREFVATLTGRCYTEVQKLVTAVAGLPEAPLSKVGNRWRFSSHEEAWQLLGNRLTSSDLVWFGASAVEVLVAKPRELVWDFLAVFAGEAGDLRPREGGGPLERLWRGAVNGAMWLLGKLLANFRRQGPVAGEAKGWAVAAVDEDGSRIFSGTLRQGIARSLVMTALYPERTLYGNECAAVSRRVVSDVLGGTAGNHVWGNLGQALVVLAEAAPEEFLNAVEEGLDDVSGPLLHLFSEKSDEFSGRSGYAWLIWALERLGWSEEHFARVANILARLGLAAEDASTGRSAIASASELFEPAIRFTDASDEARLRTLERLVRQHPDAGWRVLCGAYPTSRDFLMDRQPAFWRAWGVGGAKVATRRESQAFVGELERLLVGNVGSDPERWVGMLDILWFLSDYVRRSSIALLSQRTAEMKEKPGSVDLWHELRSKMAWYRGNMDAPRALPNVCIETLERAYADLGPEDPVEFYAWRFDVWPLDPITSIWDLEICEQERLARDARRDAVREAYQGGGAQVIIRIAEQVDQPGVLGAAVADGLNKESAMELGLRQLGPADEKLVAFALGIFRRMYERFGWDALELVLVRAKKAGVDAVVLAEIFLTASADKGTWDRLEVESDLVRAAYWRGLGRRQAIAQTAEDVVFVAGQLMAVQRWSAAVELLAHTQVDFDPTCVAAAIEALQRDGVTSSEDQIEARREGTRSYSVGLLFQKLDAIDSISDARIAELEMPYVEVLRVERRPMKIYREVSGNPALFAEFVTWVYKRDDGSTDDAVDAENRTGRARIGARVLSQLRRLPGALEKGDVEPERLRFWVDEVRRTCADRGRLSVADRKIGELLAKAPVGHDGVWPAEPIRDLLEDLRSTDMGMGFVVGRRNSRGVTQRGVFEGGGQERSLEQQYRSDAARILATYPFTAGLLREIADDYGWEAKTHDDRAEWLDKSAT